MSVELLPNGEDISAINSNREEFVSLFVIHLLVNVTSNLLGATSVDFFLFNKI